jgi:nucleoside-diphosphate-sugar epimerase
MNYLVLGSEGQIGHPLCDYLTSKGNEVTGFDIASNTQEDLRVNSGLLIERMSQADFVFFLAFDVGGAQYLKTYQHTYEFISNNVKIIDKTFEALRASDTPFIFASSQMANMAHSSYGVLKALGDFYTRTLNGLIVKFWNVYGLEHDLRKFHAITDFILKGKKEGRIQLLTTGEETRQFLHTDDSSEALYLLSQQDLYRTVPRSESLHITSFEWRSILDVARVIGRQIGVPVVPGAGTDDLQRFHKNEPDPNILRYWKPRVSLEDGLKRVIMQMGSSVAK